MFALVNSLAAAGFAQNDVAKMLSELKKFGANGHLYIPGVGAISGITAGNYLDSVGVTSASVDGNVGLVLDGVGRFGAELAPALIAANWAVINTDATHLITWAGGGFRYQCDTFSPSLTIQKAGLLTVGKTYKVEITVASYVSGSLKSDSSIGIVVNGAGKFSFFIVAQNQSFNLYRNAAITDLTVSGISIEEVAGIHASQATTGYQPKLRRGIVNLLTQSDFQNGLTDAPARGGLITLSSIDAKNALAFGYDGATASYGYKAYSAAAGSSNTVAVLLKMDSGNAPVFGSATLASPLNDFLLKASSSELPALTYTIASVGSGLYVVAATGVATGSQVGVVKYANNSTNTFKVTSYGLFQGTITAQQILAAGGIPLTTSAPASSSAGAYKWEFDGTDDFMSLGSIPFQMADDHYTAVAITPNAINTGKHILNPANGAASQKVGSIAVNGNSQFSTRWVDDATNLFGLDDAVAITPGVASVLASRRAGTTGVLRKNGAQLGSISLASLGATTLTLPGVIGSYKAGANPSAISLHGVAVIKGTVTDAQALIFERGLNALSQYAVGRF